MNSMCSLHCGHFHGVDKSAFASEKDWLEKRFEFVSFNEMSGALEMTGARDIPDDPKALAEIFDRLAGLLGEGGRGRIMLNCVSTEVCFFRRKMWKLMAMHIPEDPFESVHHVA